MRKRRAGLPLSRERGRVKRIANLSIPFPRKRESSIDIARKSGKQIKRPPPSISPYWRTMDSARDIRQARIQNIRRVNANKIGYDIVPNLARLAAAR